MGRSKLSPTQLRKATSGSGIKAGCVVVAKHVRLGEDEEVLTTWPWEETRDEMWAELAVEALLEHAESLGHGMHRYEVSVDDANGKRKAATWCRVVVERERASSSGASSGAEGAAADLDGSVEAFMRFLQESYAEERKARHESLKLVHELVRAQAQTFQVVLDRSVKLEQRETERLENAPKVDADDKPPTGSDMFALALATMGPSIGQAVGAKLGEALGPTMAQIGPMVTKMASGMMDGLDGASAGGAAPVDVVSSPELPS